MVEIMGIVKYQVATNPIRSLGNFERLIKSRTCSHSFSEVVLIVVISIKNW